MFLRKYPKKNILLTLIGAICVIALLALLLGKADTPPTEIQTPARSLAAGTNEERISFLHSYGWQVETAPTQTQEVRIPQEFNDVFTRYNQIQQAQGFDLSEHAGKTAKRYVYAITNYPGSTDPFYATVLVRNNTVIGGDVTSAMQGGSMHGFEMPNQSQSGTTSNPQPTA